ncbi:MAG: helix-turn-helix domain-containing protein [Salibacteraceae bacterium]
MGLNDRLKEARKFLKLSQVRVAKENNTFQKTISDIENGKVVNIPNEYIHYFYKQGISLDWLYSGKGTITQAEPNKGYQPYKVPIALPVPTMPRSSDRREHKAPSRFEDFGKGNILALPAGFQKEYIERFQEADFLARLPSYRLPGFEVGVFRMFEVRYNTMAPTIKPGDMLICEQVTDLNLLIDDQMYVLLTPNDLLVARIINRLAQSNTIHLETDNHRTKTPEPLKREEIVEAWRARTFLSANLPTPSHWNQRIQSLEKRLVKVEAELGK